MFRSAYHGGADQRISGRDLLRRAVAPHILPQLLVLPYALLFAIWGAEHTQEVNPQSTPRARIVHGFYRYKRKGQTVVRSRTEGEHGVGVLDRQRQLQHATGVGVAFRRVGEQHQRARDLWRDR